MKLVLRAVSLLALVATILPAMLFVIDRMDLEQVQLVMLVATLVWFVSASLWIEQ